VPPSASSSVRLIIVPVGLCGQVTLISLVFGRIAALMASTSMAKPSPKARGFDKADGAADRPWGFDVGGVVWADDNEMVARRQKRCRDDEQRAGGTGGDQDVIGRKAGVLRRDQRRATPCRR